MPNNTIHLSIRIFYPFVLSLLYEKNSCFTLCLLFFPSRISQNCIAFAFNNVYSYAFIIDDILKIICFLCWIFLVTTYNYIKLSFLLLKFYSNLLKEYSLHDFEILNIRKVCTISSHLQLFFNRWTSENQMFLTQFSSSVLLEKKVVSGLDKNEYLLVLSFFSNVDFKRSINFERKIYHFIEWDEWIKKFYAKWALK